MKAYVTVRASRAGNGGLAGASRHAVRDEVWWAGIADSECGTQGQVEIGEWNPTDPRNCIRCAKVIATDAVRVAAE